MSSDSAVPVMCAKEQSKRGNVNKVPLVSTPLIDTPFERVAVDIVGQIAPPSEAVPLKKRFKITTEAVAEALLDIYSRVGILEELLTIKRLSLCPNASRLLSINGLTSSLCHTIPCVSDWLRDQMEP